MECLLVESNSREAKIYLWDFFRPLLTDLEGTQIILKF